MFLFFIQKGKIVKKPFVSHLKIELNSFSLVLYLFLNEEFYVSQNICTIVSRIFQNILNYVYGLCKY
jgi:hypothetical protein